MSLLKIALNSLNTFNITNESGKLPLAVYYSDNYVNTLQSVAELFVDKSSIYTSHDLMQESINL